MNNSYAMVFALAVSAVSVPAWAAQDAPFLSEAIKGDNSEVAMGQLAQHRGVSPTLRAYGAMLVHDHGAHRRKIALLDRKLSVVPTTDLSDDGAHAKAMLQGLHGAQFDAAFKQHMIEDHTQDIAKYEEAARSAHEARVRALAQETLPTLHKHLDHAKAL
jgi:putative membrane protein